MVIQKLSDEELGGAVGQMVHHEPGHGCADNRIRGVNDGGAEAGKRKILKKSKFSKISLNLLC